MITAFIFFVHFIFTLIIFTKKWQDENLSAGFLNIALIAILFAVGWTITGMIAKLVMEKKHLTKDGLLEITQLREELNKGKGRTRKYNLHDVEESLKGNPQRLHARPRKFREEHF